MKTRPELVHGDLVKRKKPNDDGTMYRVIRITSRSRDRCNLGAPRYPKTSEGFLDVHTIDKAGRPFTFKRRDLWRVPNQPRLRNNKGR